MIQKKIIPVQRFTQKSRSFDCGPTTARTILHSFGIEKSLQELAAKLRYGDFGTYISDNGLLFLAHGLSVTLITANTILFDFEDRKRLTTKMKVKIYFKKLIRGRIKTITRFKPGIRIMLEFLKAGGDIRIEIPQKKHITEALNQGKLIMALVVPNAFSTFGSFHHFVAVHGYDKDGVYITDPRPKATAGKVQLDDFLYSIHASTVGDRDTGQQERMSIKDAIQKVVEAVG